MWKLWLLFDPRRALIAVLLFAFAMALLIHFIVLSSPRYSDHLGWGAATTAATKAPVPAAKP
jgi:light-harvesting complex 1 alpha chain